MRKLLNILLVGSLLTSTSCVDLDLAPHNQLAGTTMWTTPDNAKKGRMVFIMNFIVEI